MTDADKKAVESEAISYATDKYCSSDEEPSNEQIDDFIEGANYMYRRMFNAAYRDAQANEASAEFPEIALAVELNRRSKLKVDPLPADDLLAYEFEAGARWGFEKGRASCSEIVGEQHSIISNCHAKIADLEAKLASHRAAWKKDVDVKLSLQSQVFELDAKLYELKDKLADAQAEIERLKREVDVLRIYGNKTATAMADEALKAKTSAES